MLIIVPKEICIYWGYESGRVAPVFSSWFVDFRLRPPLHLPEKKIIPSRCGQASFLPDGMQHCPYDVVAVNGFIVRIQPGKTLPES